MAEQKIYPFKFSWEAWEDFQKLQGVQNKETGLVDHWLREDGRKLYPAGVEVWEDGTACIRLELREAECEVVDVIFHDEANKLFRCKEWGGYLWLFYWHPDKKWVSLRKVTKQEADSFPRNFTEEEQAMYKEGE